jgi:hypothetical protein
MPVQGEMKKSKVRTKKSRQSANPGNGYYPLINFEIYQYVRFMQTCKA